MTPSKQIVVIDDEADMCWVLDRLMRHRGYSVATATSGDAGLKLLQQTHVDLAIIDCKLPDKDGVDIAADALRLWPHLEIILISGFPFAEESALRERVQELHAHFLAKPFEVTDLAILVDRVLAAETGH